MVLRAVVGLEVVLKEVAEWEGEAMAEVGWEVATAQVRGEAETEEAEKAVERAVAREAEARVVAAAVTCHTRAGLCQYRMEPPTQRWCSSTRCLRHTAQAP